MAEIESCDDQICRNRDNIQGRALSEMIMLTTPRLELCLGEDRWLLVDDRNLPLTHIQSPPQPSSITKSTHLRINSKTKVLSKSFCCT